MGNPVLYTLIGILLTFAIFMANVIYRTGHLSARVEELERWRIDIRKDMHEISDKLETMTTALQHLTTVIEERTERRLHVRETPFTATRKD